MFGQKRGRGRRENRVREREEALRGRGVSAGEKRKWEREEKIYGRE